jgi:metacaspase-1
MATGRSIHIGLNTVDPAHYDGWDGALTACEFDANDMQKLAEGRGFQSTKLLTQEATADAVKAAIEGAANELSDGDFLFITYSGHGGQVPDKNAEEEPDRSDETWVLYDRQLVDDELYQLWAKFEPGVSIFVLSDSCHSGSVLRAIEDDEIVPNVMAKRETAAAQSPRYRALPLDVMVKTYRDNKDEYDAIQASAPTSAKAEVRATALLISGCQDEQLSLDGVGNGLFTGTLLEVWNDGAWQGDYASFHQAILARMPESQQPNYMKVGAANSKYEGQDPLQVESSAD